MKLRDLPAVDEVAKELSAASDVPDAVVVVIVRSVIDEARATLLAGETPADPFLTASDRVATVGRARPKKVINGTGVLLHTNLGRAAWDESIAAEAGAIASGYSNVEVDVSTGRRASRHDYLDPLIAATTGAEAGLAVNNNAGALLLALAAIGGQGGRVAVSRGELIEIGGAFRLPELMRASGVELVEVGTTNRTRQGDYATVVDSVDAILKVHPSNYRIDGFQEEATWAELAQLADDSGTPFIADVGSGLLDADAPWVPTDLRRWLSDEPGVRQTVGLGADVVLFSGDKLLGGPQAGILSGSRASIDRIRSHPIARAVRLDGSTIAALAGTLERYADNTVRTIPFWSMATASLEELQQRAERIAAPWPDIEIVASEAVPGAGSVPGATIPSVAIHLPGDPDDVWLKLANAKTSVIGTRKDGVASIDLRSVRPSEDALVGEAIVEAVG